MKEEIIFLSGLIIGGLVIAVGAGRLDLFLSLVTGMVTGMATGLVFIIGLEIFFIGIAEFVKWLEKRITQ